MCVAIVLPAELQFNQILAIQVLSSQYDKNKIFSFIYHAQLDWLVDPQYQNMHQFLQLQLQLQSCQSDNKEMSSNGDKMLYQA